MSETAHEKPEPPDKCPQVEIIRESDKEQHARAMGDAELCEFITKALSPAKKILRDSLAYIAEARKRFAQPGRRVPVAGKPTWGSWIKQNLGISDRHVRRLLAGEREPQKTRSKKPEPRVEVESAGIILGNKGLEMARKLRDGEVDAAKRIAAEMLEADLDCPDSLLPPPAPEHAKTIGEGDIETLASLWRQVFGALTRTRRRDMLVRFFGQIPEEDIADIAAAIDPGPVHGVCTSAARKVEGGSGGDSRKHTAQAKVAVRPSVQGGSACNPPISGTSPTAEGRGDAPAKKGSPEYKLRKARQQSEYCQRNKKKAEARAAAPAAAEQPSGGAAVPRSDLPGGKGPTVSPVERRPVLGKPPAPVKITVCSPVLSPEEAEREHETLDAASGHPGRRLGNFVRDEKGKYEYEPELGMSEAEEIRNAQPGGQQLPPSKPIAAAAKPFRVKKRTTGDITDFAVTRDGDRLPDEVFDSTDEAVSHCESLNKSLVANIVPQHIDPQSAAQPAAC
jgi:hypothetical protein